MNYQLLTSDDYRDAPPEPEMKFAYLEELARDRLFAIVDESQSASIDSLLKETYMSVVRSSAGALGLTGLPAPTNGTLDDQFRRFLLAATALVTRIHVTHSQAGKDTVRLASETRVTIQKKISRLRVYVEQAENIPEAKRAALLRKLDELLAELNERTRLSIGKAMAILGSVLVGTTTFLAEAPDAAHTVTNIISAIFQDQEAEEAEAARLGPPPAALALTDQREAQESRGSFDGDLDDDVPF